MEIYWDNLGYDVIFKGLISRILLSGNRFYPTIDQGVL